MAHENYYRDKILNLLKKKYGYDFLVIDTGASSTGKKPFDVMLIKNGKCMAIEFKKGYNSIESHQLRSLIDFDCPGIIIRIQNKTKIKEIVVSYPSGSIVFSTELRYKKFVTAFHITFSIYFIHNKLSKYNVHNEKMMANAKLKKVRS